MRKTIALLALTGLAAAPAVTLADDNNTGCGLGTMVFDGQSGVGPQILAVTTNGTFGNQTFGISSGTLGCDQDGTVNHTADAAEFTRDNMDRLASDMAAGEGETLATVSDLMGVPAADQDRFGHLMQANFERIFPSTTTTARDVVASMRELMAEDTTLSTYLS